MKKEGAWGRAKPTGKSQEIGREGHSCGNQLISRYRINKRLY